MRHIMPRSIIHCLARTTKPLFLSERFTTLREIPLSLATFFTCSPW